MKTDTQTQTSIAQKRDKLKALSITAREKRDKYIAKAVNDGVQLDAMFYSSCTINYFLAIGYKDQTGATEFNTFYEWQKKGYKVMKGSKAYLFWGRKIGTIKKNSTATAEDDYNFFPISFMFSNLQVTKI